MARPKPWDGLIPAADLASFSAGAADSERPIAAGRRPAVIVVDMTRAFVDSAYPAGWSETGWPAVDAIASLLDTARAAAVPVLYTQAYPWADHRPRPAERGRWRSTPGPPPSRSLPPSDVIVDKLAPHADDIVLHKGSKPSAFFGTPLTSYLVFSGVDTVIVTGMTTSGCVRATVLDAFQYSFRVIVPHECVADRSQISHAVSLFDMHMKYADVVSLSETLDYLDDLGG